MLSNVLTFGGKAARWYGKCLTGKHRTQVNVALGVLGAAVVAKQAYYAKRRATAMQGKIVVIAGGSRGLGLEIARQFGLGGAHLVLASRTEEELHNALGTLHQQGAIPNGEAAHIVVADVSKQADCDRIIASAIERFGRIDVLVNCAAVMQVAPFQDMTTEAFEQAMQVNFFGALYATQAVVPHMLAQGSGNIVNIASVGGKVAVPHMLPYVASKFALVGFGEGLHAELRHKGIRVLTVCPGLMRTGAESGVKFAGQAKKEYRWFKFSANAPGISISARAAAHKVYAATVAGKAEITITPQAWLGARAAGIAPNLTFAATAAINQLVLPAPNGNKETTTGRELAKLRWTQAETSARP